MDDGSLSTWCSTFSLVEYSCETGYMEIPSKEWQNYNILHCKAAKLGCWFVITRQQQWHFGLSQQMEEIIVMTYDNRCNAKASVVLL